MRRIFVIMLGISLLAGCSAIGGMGKPTGNFIKVVSFKIGLGYEKGRVVKIENGSPAELAGVKLGDIFKGIFYKGAMISKDEYKTLPFKMQPGDYLVYVMERNGGRIECIIRPDTVDVLPTYYEINRILRLEKKRVDLAVIVGQLQNEFLDKSDKSKKWFDEQRIEMQSQNENQATRIYEKDINFSVVERAALSPILDEFKFGRTGYVSDKLRTKIGQMTGATHIIAISVARNSAIGRNDNFTRRLIEIESGKVLAIDRYATPYYDNYKDKDKDKILREISTGRDPFDE
jgi:hypothetical protein